MEVCFASRIYSRILFRIEMHGKPISRTSMCAHIATLQVKCAGNEVQKQINVVVHIPYPSCTKKCAAFPIFCFLPQHLLDLL